MGYGCCWLAARMRCWCWLLAWLLLTRQPPARPALHHPCRAMATEAGAAPPKGADAEALERKYWSNVVINPPLCEQCGVRGLGCSAGGSLGGS